MKVELSKKKEVPSKICFSRPDSARRVSRGWKGFATALKFFRAESMRRHASERCIHHSFKRRMVSHSPRQNLLCAPTKSWSWIWSGKMRILTYAGLFGGVWYTCGTNSRVAERSAQIYLILIRFIEWRDEKKRLDRTLEGIEREK